MHVCPVGSCSLLLLWFVDLEQESCCIRMPKRPNKSVYVSELVEVLLDVPAITQSKIDDSVNVSLLRCHALFHHASNQLTSDLIFLLVIVLIYRDRK
jgi:hypothetical protein